MGKGRTKVSVPSNTVLGQLQQSLSLHIKQCRKAGQPVRLSASQFEADVALVLGSFEQDQGSHTARLDAASEAFQVLTQLLPLAPDSAQDVSRDARRLIVQRCWSLWEATGAMTHCARAALKALISLEKQEETQPGVAASNLLDLLKAHSLANKRSLGCLHVLLPVIPQSYFQLHFPDLLPQLLHIITLSELAPHAGKVAVELVQLLLAPSKHDDTEAIVYSDIATSLTRRLLHSDFQSRTFLGLYLLLPIITLDSRWYNALHDNLNSSGSEPTGSESALAASFCLIETGLKAGAVTRQSISKEMLDLGLSSCESSLRMSALSIICRPPPTRQVFLAKDDFDLLEKHFLHHISQTSDSEERNAVSGHWKVLLDRTKASTHAAARSLQSHDKNSDASYFQTHLDEAKTFLLAACNIFVDRLQPTSPYRAQSSALRFLSNMLLIGLFSCWKSSTPIPPSLQRTQVEWPFSLESHLDMTRLLRLVSRCLVSTYEDIQNTAAWVLHGFPTAMLPACLRDDTQLRSRIQTLTTSGRECRAESAALLLKFAQRQNHTKSAFKLALAAAETEIDQVKHNLALAAASFPMHGAIQCLMCVPLTSFCLFSTSEIRAPLVHR